jgi:hypothetical protein
MRLSNSSEEGVDPGERRFLEQVGQRMIGTEVNAPEGPKRKPTPVMPPDETKLWFSPFQEIAGTRQLGHRINRSSFNIGLKSSEKSHMCGPSEA